MQVISNKLAVFGLGYAFYCPGCERMHEVAVNSPFPNGAQWAYNNDPEKPTFSPSLHIKGEASCCHSFVREGNIEFLSDCTHKLAGQTVALPPLPEWVLTREAED
ncbi:MAG: hypothetical protein KAR40_11110 [Candidatus Sabulitectum sp.]|nr:hypothetical protein [Candidatus Sabulitectum sp.]